MASTSTLGRVTYPHLFRGGRVSSGLGLLVSRSLGLLVSRGLSPLLSSGGVSSGLRLLVGGGRGVQAQVELRAELKANYHNLLWSAKRRRIKYGLQTFYRFELTPCHLSLLLSRGFGPFFNGSGVSSGLRLLVGGGRGVEAQVELKAELESNLSHSDLER